MKHNLTKGRMDDFFVLRMGKTPPRDNPTYWVDGTNEWVAISDMGKSKYIASTSECISDLGISDCNMQPVPNNTVIMSFKLSIGKIAITSKPLFTNEAIMAFMPKPEYSNEIMVDYIYYYLMGYRWGGTGKKAVMGITLNKASLSATPFSFPKKEVQEQIVAELDKINEVIEDCRELLRNLDALAQSLFYDYFGDPVTNPKGWTVCKVSDNFETGSGGTPSKSIPEFWNSNDIPWIGSNMCQNEILHKTDGKFISNLGLQNSSAKLLYPDTLLVALVGATIGKVALLKIPTSTNQNIGFIKPNKNIANPIFLFYTLQGLYPLFLGIGNGKFKMANLSFIRDLPIILPPLELQEKFAERIEQIDAQKKAVEETIANLQTLLDSRMDYWFN